MRWQVPVLAVFTFASLATPEVFDFGDLDQYKSRSDAEPEVLQANAIWITELDGGFQMFLGKDTQAKVDGVIEGCGKTIDSKCFEEVSKVLEETPIQTDETMDRRQILAGISAIYRAFKLVKNVGKAIAWLAAVLGTVAASNRNNSKGTFWPGHAASSLGNLPPTGTLTVSAEGKVIATVTQVPEATSLEGSSTPSITPMASASGTFHEGDLVFFLDKNLASRIGEYMQRSKDCDAGSEFDSKHPPAKRSSGGTYGQAICAAESVVRGTTPGGPWNDLLLMNPNGPHFGIADGAGAAREAADVFAEFVTAYAPLMAVPEDLARQICVYIFALAIDAVVENIALGAKNRIKSDLVATSTTEESRTTTSATACPEPTALLCGLKGEDCPSRMKTYKDGNKGIVCKTGKHKDCPCSSPPLMVVNRVNVERQKFLMSVAELLGSKSTPPPKKKRPDCPVKVTNMQSNVFSSDETNVYSQFCEKFDKKDELRMKVDPNGKSVNPEPHLGRRTPPPDPDSYKDWTFFLTFVPTKGQDVCSFSCKDAFAEMKEACSSNAGGVYLYEHGSLDVGCGKFAYQVNPPKKEEPPEPKTTELKEFDQKCYGPSDYDGKQANSGRIPFEVGYACRGVGRKEQIIKKGDKSTFTQWLSKTNGKYYQFNVWWVDGCTLENNGPTELYASNPLDVPNPGDDVCQKSLLRNYKTCNKDHHNQGRGGYIQIGCLMYEFKTDGKKREF